MSGELLGIIITIVFGLPSIIALINHRKEKTIRYWHVETESIFSEKINEVSNLKVFYHDVQINENIIILKTVIENNGKKDIDKSIVYEPFTIDFEKSIELLEVEVMNSPCKVNAIKKQNSIICNWDLLKKKEFIILKIILKNTEKEKNLKSCELLNKYSNVHFRITDLSEPKKINYTNSISNKIDYSVFAMPLMLFILSIFMIIISIVQKPYIIKYCDEVSSENYYSLQANDESSLILKYKDEKKLVSLDEYNKREQIPQIKLFHTNSNLIILLLYFLVLLCSILSFIANIASIKRDKKIRYFFKQCK